MIFNLYGRRELEVKVPVIKFLRVTLIKYLSLKSRGQTKLH